MSIGKKFAGLAAALAVFAAPLSQTSAEDGPKTHRRHFHKKLDRCPLHRTMEGELADCHGWRLRDNATGWDNSCFNLDYLPSQFACSARGRR